VGGNGSDIVIASERASFALPEVKRGVFAKAGALGRIIRFLGPTSPASFLYTQSSSSFYIPFHPLSSLVFGVFGGE